MCNYGLLPLKAVISAIMLFILSSGDLCRNMSLERRIFRASMENIFFVVCRLSVLKVASGVRSRA